MENYYSNVTSTNKKKQKQKQNLKKVEVSLFLTFVNTLFIAAMALFFPLVHLEKAHGGRRISRRKAAWPKRKVLSEMTELKKLRIRTNKTKQTVTLRLVFFMVDL